MRSLLFTHLYIEEKIRIDHIRSVGKQAIILISEIAITYQVVKRFRRRVGE